MLPFIALMRDGDPSRERWLRFDHARAVHCARVTRDVMPLLAEAEHAATRGLWAVVCVSYEAATAFDPALVTHAPGSFPLAWCAVCDAPQYLTTLPESDATPSLSSSPSTWQADPGDAAHADGVRRVRAYIEAGDTCQVNLTRRLRAPFTGDAYAFFADRYRVQPTVHAACLRLPEHDILSFSPELFFTLDNGHLLCRPMKGTRPRGRWAGEDRQLRDELVASPKDRAENAMIVDMMRNDCGRVAQPGSVRVLRAFEAERYRTVWQMTSTVEARTDAGPAAVMRALFPCASVTGAPKVRTMQLIRELESSPRGAYCGAIGFLAPGGRACFAVAIRTVTVERATHRAEYGVGGGIVWDSDPEGEVEETRVKARALTRQESPFALLETLLWRPRTGYRFLTGHLRRLTESAAYFGFPCELETVRRRLEAEAAVFGSGAMRVRLLLEHDGAIRMEHAPMTLARPRAVMRLALTESPVDESSPLFHHKTTARAAYDSARAAAPAWADDVLLVNMRGEVTESLIANALFLIDGAWVTPPRASGALGGVMRAELLARGRVREAVVRAEDLPRAERILLVNSVRGFMPAMLGPARETVP